MGLALLVAVAGCPTYEDTYSGTYREQDVDPTAATRAIELDFFRFGGNANAILRFYEPNVRREEPFATERFCTRTEGEDSSFDPEKRTFSLPIERGAEIPESRIRGKILSEAGNRLRLSVTDTEGNRIVEETTLHRSSPEPNSNCNSIDVFSVQPRFDLRGGAPNTMPDNKNYDVEHPVLSVQWVGRAIRGDKFVPTNASGPSERLGTQHFVDGAPREKSSPDELRGQVGLRLPPPPDEIRTESSDTTYAVGHLVVIDDSAESGSFSWEIEGEPIVASALQHAAPEEKRNDPDLAKINASGKAILFVEDELSDLENELRTVFFEHHEKIEDGEIPESHFYVVDVYYDYRSGDIRQLSLPTGLKEHRQNRGIPIKMTGRYLDQSSPRLPRLR